MIEQDVLVNTKYGRQPAFAVCPDGPGRFPGIILYMDAPGFREELREHGRRIAKHGYFCLVPDLYYRLGTLRFDVPRRTDTMSAVIRAAMNSLTNEAVADDSAGMIAFLDGQDRVMPGPLGCVGHCMSGPFALTVAAQQPRMRAAAALYGVDMVTDRADSPHLLVDRIQGELYLGFAEFDPAVPPTVGPALQRALDQAGTKHRLETFAGAHHGFLFANRPDYDPIAAEEGWARLFDLWDRNLK
ncbi:MAG: dienelactone hydrolase family protein [Pseudomonadota bacterium]